jgi:hypothetical protein
VLSVDFFYILNYLGAELDAAHAALEAKWGEEERAAIKRRHTAIRSMVKGISAKTLLQQTGKSVRVCP